VPLLKKNQFAGMMNKHLY